MIRAEIVAHSKNQQGDELISVLATFPRIILAEVNTHRMLSKNTSSSRAIPFKKMLETIQENPFIPIAWQKEHSGMQGSEYWEGEQEILDIQESWLLARDQAVIAAKDLTANKVTKQLANRLLEPFMWTTMLITGSKEGWDNFFHLRCPSYQVKESEPVFKSWKDVANHYEEETRDFWTGLAYDNMDIVERLKLNKGQAEIHMMDLAEKIWDATNKSTPKLLQPGEWHIPFEDKMENVGLGGDMHVQSLSAQHHTLTARKVKVSTAMGARTSYTVVGEEKEINPETLIGLHDRLTTQQPPHSSPMEHCSRCMTDFEYETHVKGLVPSAITEGDLKGFTVIPFTSKGWCYNHKGFIPYRYLIDNNLTL